MATEVQITFELPAPEWDEAETFYKVDLECRISSPEQDVGWLGHLEDYDVLSVSPAWHHGEDRLYDALRAHEAEIEQTAFSVEGDA